LTSTVGADEKINFTGYYGDYQLTVGGQVYNFTLSKGSTSYAIGFPTGDLNFDGKVNLADYATWRKNDGTTAGYVGWRSGFGVAASGAELHGESVPEPAGGFLAAWFVFLFGTHMRPKRTFHARSKLERGVSKSQGVRDDGDGAETHGGGGDHGV
jgi:hypothetical protein